MNKPMTQSLNKYTSFFQLIGKLTDCIIVINASGSIVYMNPNGESLFTVKSGDMIGSSINLLIPNFPSRELINEFESSSFFGVRGDFQYINIQIDSQSISIDDELFKVLIVKELVNYREKDDQLSILNMQLADIKLALDESTIIAITDAKGTITLANQKFCELSQFTEKELIGQNHRILSSGYHSKEFFREMWRTIGSGKIWKGEVQNRAKDGSLYWVDTTIVPFIGKNGKPYQYVSIRTDITKRVEMEKKLHDAIKIDFIETIKNLQNGIFKMKRDTDGKFIYTMAEGKLLEKIGADSEKLLAHTPAEVFPKEIAEVKQQHYEKAFEGNRVNYEIELQGKLVFVDVTPIQHGDTVVEIVGSVHDISELRSTQKELLMNQQHYQSLFEHSQDCVISFDSSGRVMDMNPMAMELLACTKETMNNLTIRDLFSEKYQEITDNFFEKAVLGHVQNIEIERFNQQGEKLVFNVVFLPIIIDEQIKGVYTIGKDISEQKKINETNAYLAHHDELTKLPNRRWIEQKLNESLLEANEKNEMLAVMFIDLDRFKFINDTLGHLIGDRLLQHISERLQETVHPGKQFAARMGGDEFMILLPVIHQQEDAVNLAKKLLRKLTYPFMIENHELFVTPSIGISFYPIAGTTAVDLMKKADIALYRAKEQGRNSYQIYNPSMDERNYQSFILEREMRKAILNNEFILHYQPRVDAHTGKTIGAEALIRWMHPKIGLIPPAEFIPIAEESGFIIQLGKWVKRKVCEQLAAWREAGIPLMPIGVNISSQRFLQKEFSNEVRDLLKEFNLEGKWLEFEITENSLMKKEQYILQNLIDLKAMGIKIYIDDFGTGYSSFNYLKTFKLDGIKIDRSFVQNISSQSDNAEITIAMIKMAKHLKMDVIAEGVETKEELSFLVEQNCHHVQGYYFGKPCTIQEFQMRHGDGSDASSHFSIY